MELEEIVMPTIENALNDWSELERLKVCRKAVTDLLVPEPNLDAVDRDALCELMGYLDEKETEVMTRLHPRLQAGV